MDKYGGDINAPDHANYYCKGHNGPTTVTNGKCNVCGSTKIEPLSNVDTNQGQNGGSNPPPPSGGNNNNSNDNSGSSNGGNSQDTSQDESKSSGGFFSSLFGNNDKPSDSSGGIFSKFMKGLDSWTDDDINDSFFGDDVKKDSVLKGSLYGGVYNTIEGNNKDSELYQKLQNVSNDTGGNTEAECLETPILGQPLYYNKTADPYRRTFNNTIIYDNPTVYILPGKPKINKKLIKVNGSKINFSLDDYYEKLNDNDETGKQNFGFGIINPKNNQDMRYVAFTDNYPEYYKYVQTLASTVNSYLSAEDGEAFKVYRFSDQFKNSVKDYGISYYMDKASTIGESADNSYSASRIAEEVNEKSSVTREASTIGNYGKFTELAQGVYQNLASLVSGKSATAESLKSFEGVLDKTANQFIKIVNGSQLDFPDVWQDSKFSRSYNLHFKFYSPYGDKEAIMKYVYAPFLSLLALVLP